MIEAGIESGAKLIAFEKPVALTSAEGFEIRELLARRGVKAVVSHQHRYGEHYRKVQEIIASGALGRVHTVYGTATGWMMHMLSHLMDYTRWFNDGAEARMGHGPGRRTRQAGRYPSFARLHRGIHSFFQRRARRRRMRGGRAGCAGSALLVAQMPHRRAGDRRFCRSHDRRRLARGDQARRYSGGEGSMNYDLDMPPYIQEMADWLDDHKKVHPCNFDSAYKGFEIMMAFCRSAANGGQVALPLDSGMDEIQLLRDTLPAGRVILSMRESAKEYPA